GGFISLAPHHEDAGGNASPEKEILSKPDDRFDVVALDQLLADLILPAPAKKNAMRHDSCHDPATAQRGEHVESEEEVGFFLFRRVAVAGEALLVGELALVIAEAEGWIGEDSVEPGEFASF